MKKILLTGADGMLGNHICRELLSRGYGVRVLLQPGRNNHSLEDLELDAIYADITDESSVGAAMEGMDALIHVAASTQTTAVSTFAPRRMSSPANARARVPAPRRE
jgi:dihydroflavonol-4-reductase